MIGGIIVTLVVIGFFLVGLILGIIDSDFIDLSGERQRLMDELVETLNYNTKLLTETAKMEKDIQQLKDKLWIYENIGVTDKPVYYDISPHQTRN